MIAIGEKYVYFGNLFPEEPQFESGKFLGLALNPRFERDIPHDASRYLPFTDNSVAGFQSQDVFEHIPREKISTIFDDIYRCLKKDGVFRLSLPDYNCPLLKKRSVYDYRGNVLADVAMGGTVKAKLSGSVEVEFPPGGDAHLWFPTYNQITGLILDSEIRKCDRITFLHYWIDSNNFVLNEIDHTVMPVRRTPPGDMRADGAPISIVVDFIK